MNRQQRLNVMKQLEELVESSSTDSSPTVRGESAADGPSSWGAEQLCAGKDPTGIPTPRLMQIYFKQSHTKRKLSYLKPI